MREITGASHVTIAVKKKNEDVLEKLRELAAPHGFNFLVYPDVYPAGDEYVLVYEVTKRMIPPGGIPLDVGCVVDNVETVINVAHAVANRPVTEKYVTVTGEVKSKLRELAVASDADVVFVEIGGTVGDVENAYYIEAVRELAFEEGANSCAFVALTYIISPPMLGEQKSKAAQL